MAEESNGATTLQTTAHIPIAQLTPLLPAPASRSIKAIVTLTWPYSSATASVAFLLSEPDFRLRRTRGQVRVQFSGSSAKEVAKSGIASGDQVILSLDGVEWVHNEGVLAAPGRGVEFELKFAERLVLQFQQEDSQDLKTIDIDYPATELEVAAPLRIPTPELAISPSAASTITSSGPPDSATKAGDDEFISPAFIKRARTSYGSLFDSDYDPFTEEDGTVRGKGRKRTRLSSTWRYSSRSPTPEAETEAVEPVIAPLETVTKPKPVMTDEGCQTIGLEEGGAAETLANFARQSTNVGRDSYPFINASAPKSVPQSENMFEDTAMSREPPTLLRQHKDGLERLETNQIASQSPHLQPVSSDFLPQVSPLLSRNTLIPANPQSTEGVENGQNLILQSQVPHTNLQMTSADVEDLYGASPTGRRGEQTQLEVPGFHNLAADANGVEPPFFEGQYESEDQYGHWQSSTHLSHHASPYPATEAVSGELQTDRFYVEEGGEEVEQYDHIGIPESHAEMLHSHQYPEIDDGLPDQQLSGWGNGVSNVPYPELPNHTVGLEHDTAMQPPQPRSAAMSRSQSGQSQVVDLTESSDEEEAAPAERAVEDDGSLLLEDDDGEILEDEDDEDSLDEQDEQGDDVIRSRHYPRAIPREDDFEGEKSEGEEQYYDDDDDNELEEDGADIIDERFNVGPGQEFYNEDEEGSYESEDEDMNAEGPRRPSVQREPEVIDLLSSDDEDSAPPPQPKPTISTPARLLQAPTQGRHGSEESEEDEDADGKDSEDSVPYAEREELQIRNTSREGSVEEDVIMEDERGQDIVDESAREDENESEIDAQDERAVALELLEGPVKDQPMEDGQGERHDLVFVENAERGDQHFEQENLDDILPAEVKNYVQAAIPGQFGRSQTSPSKSSVFQRLFNFDGANDDPEEEISYPTLPKDELSPPASDPQAVSQTSEIYLQKLRNTHLPTPDATQSFGKTVSTETSFTSNTDILPGRTEQPQASDSNTIKMETEQLKVIVETSGPVDVEVETKKALAETATVTDKTAKIKIDDEDVEMTQEVTLEAIAEPKLSEDQPLVDKTIEEKLVEEEHNLDTAEPESMEKNRVEEQAVENQQGLDTAAHDSMDSEADQEQIDEEVMQEKSDLNPGEHEFTEFEGLQEQIDQQVAEEEQNLETEDPESLEPEVVQEQIDEQIFEEVESKPGKPKSIETEPAEGSLFVEEPENDEDSIIVGSSPFKQVGKLDALSKEPEFTVDSPRRSHRRAKPSATVANKKENIRPVSPTKTDNTSARQRRELATPKVMLDTRAPPKGHDASIELALESLGSPTKPQHDLRKPPVTDLKLRLSRALRTELSEFTALKVLRYHLNQKLDVLAVATTIPDEPQRAKNGPRHYQITFNVTDPSIAPSGVTEIQIFRPYKDALPTIQAGDGILLRNFQVISVKSRGFGLRSVTDEGSSWAVFKDEGKPEVRGPPVEFGDSEKKHVVALKAWYSTLDVAAMAKINRANGEKVGVGVGKSIAKAS